MSDVVKKIEGYLNEKDLTEVKKISDDEKGQKLADFLGLKKKGDRYNTSFGNKTAKGLWVSLKRYMDEVEAGID